MVHPIGSGLAKVSQLDQYMVSNDTSTTTYVNMAITLSKHTHNCRAYHEDLHLSFKSCSSIADINSTSYSDDVDIMSLCHVKHSLCNPQLRHLIYNSSASGFSNREMNYEMSDIKNREVVDEWELFLVSVTNRK